MEHPTDNKGGSGNSGSNSQGGGVATTATTVTTTVTTTNKATSAVPTGDVNMTNLIIAITAFGLATYVVILESKKKKQ